MAIEENLNESLQAFSRLLKIIDDLRTKCPWDQQQTMSSLRPMTIEETFELSEAILSENMINIKEELGDLLLHILLYTRIATEDNSFTTSECINALCDKLIHRHPHIYQPHQTAVNTLDVNKNWQKVKLAEKGRNSILQGIPNSLPSLSKAMCIQDKASSAGFIWKTREEAWGKVKEEIQELEEEVRNINEIDSVNTQIEDELGDVLSSLITYACFINVDPDRALEKANLKFIRRFQCVERQLKEDNKELSALSIEEMVAYWKQAKAQLHAVAKEQTPS
ncbi:MAG: nucleoside triphosphate pyrophosphohydrolase [Candidatus Amoebophilus sp.]